MNELWNEERRRMDRSSGEENKGVERRKEKKEDVTIIITWGRSEAPRP